MHAPTRLLASQFGSPHGVTAQDSYVRLLWHLAFYFALPLGLIVLGGIAWCLVRYRAKPGSERRASQFQYHIPIEAAYTIIPLIIVAVIFGFMFNAENHVDRVSRAPAVKITVEGFQWGWRFVYPNGHQEIGTVANALNINSMKNLPVLYMPAGETVQFTLKSDDVVHTFYVRDWLWQRDLIPGVHNVADIDVKNPGIYDGQCNNICGQYHAYMRFLVDVMPVKQYKAWYAHQAANSITTAGVTVSS